ncbi:hypothetical protein GQ43DRAFT_471170 [Delitschia confertaspora ATCC 74209]|uniref:Uncharacterized protein n=1 Tax=Delitschia confertaspora ATCC 74209 TaxID=1513339 RepID=A0A9P4MT39_9PLEO|nr:hypothetical protein GQ43DRAFT_471170 [Delitschia confertaspora ATCC 74209]
MAPLKTLVSTLVLSLMVLDTAASPYGPSREKPATSIASAISPNAEIPAESEAPAAETPGAEIVSQWKSFFKNNCAFGVYVEAARCVDDPTKPAPVSGVKYIAPGGEFENPFKHKDDACSHTIRSSTQQDQTANVYQVEYSVRDGNIWYDLSDIDGHPLLQYKRSLEVKQVGCERIFCDAKQGLAGSGPDCEWPYFQTCKSGDIEFYLC